MTCACQPTGALNKGVILQSILHEQCIEAVWESQIYTRCGCMIVVNDELNQRIQQHCDLCLAITRIMHARGVCIAHLLRNAVRAALLKVLQKDVPPTNLLTACRTYVRRLVSMAPAFKGRHGTVCIDICVGRAGGLGMGLLA